MTVMPLFASCPRTSLQAAHPFGIFPFPLSSSAPAASVSVLLKYATSILRFCIYRNHNTAMRGCQLFYRKHPKDYRKSGYCMKRMSRFRITSARAIFRRSGMIKGTTHMERALHSPMGPDPCAYTAMNHAVPRA